MPLYFASHGAFVTIVIWAAVALALLGGLLVTLSLWQSRFKLADFRSRFTRSTSTTFVGREAEQNRFLELAKNVGTTVAEARAPLWLLISGARGDGKRALLLRFRDRALAEKSTILCGPVIDLREPQQIDKLLEKIAAGPASQTAGAI